MSEFLALRGGEPPPLARALRGPAFDSWLPLRGHGAANTRADRVPRRARRTRLTAPRRTSSLLGCARQPSATADLMFVALMCACCSEVLAGNLPGPYTDALGETGPVVLSPSRHRIDMTSGLWSRRPRVRVPSLTPQEVPANGGFRREADRSVLRDGDRYGDSFSCNYRRDPGEEGGDEPPIRFRGDELDLYGEFHLELVKTVAARVGATPGGHRGRVRVRVGGVLPLPARPRAGNWKGWLVTVGQARGVAAERAGAEGARGRAREDLPMEPVDPRDRHARACWSFGRRSRSCKKLPPLLQEVVVIHSQVNRQPGRGRHDGSQPAARRDAAYPGGACGSRSSTRSDMRTSVRWRRRGRRGCASSRRVRRSG